LTLGAPDGGRVAKQCVPETSHEISSIQRCYHHQPNLPGNKTQKRCSEKPDGRAAIPFAGGATAFRMLRIACFSTIDHFALMGRPCHRTGRKNIFRLKLSKTVL
jgi:hypothetical protein